jgi:nicotinate-nucleotide--dimethylbenzimidazole phosphoribosyltransferase
VNRLDADLKRVFGDPPESPRAVMRVQVSEGRGLQAGWDEADRFVDAGADLVVLDSEISGPAPLAAIGLLLSLEPVGVVGTLTRAEWKDQVLAVRDAMRRGRDHVMEPIALVEALGDPAFGRVVGILDRLAERQTPVLLGGGTSTAAAVLVASRIRFGGLGWWIAGSAPPTTAGVSAVTGAGLSPLLDLGLTHGSADIAVAVVRAGLEALGA